VFPLPKMSKRQPAKILGQRGPGLDQAVETLRATSRPALSTTRLVSGAFQQRRTGDAFGIRSTRAAGYRPS